VARDWPNGPTMHGVHLNCSSYIGDCVRMNSYESILDAFVRTHNSRNAMCLSISDVDVMMCGPSSTMHKIMCAFALKCGISTNFYLLKTTFMQL